MHSTLHVCSLNCQGLGQKNKRERLVQWCKSQKCDILYAQETHFVKNNAALSNNTDFGNSYHSFGRSNSRGVSIFIKKELQYSLIDTFEDSNGRILLINIEINDNILTLVNVYAPNCEKDRNIFFKKINNLIDKHRLGVIILGGI